MSIVSRVCGRCKQPGSPGPRELRPYGENGSDLCAECFFGKSGSPSPAMEKTAKKQLATQLMQPDPLILDPREQVGPRSIRPKGRS